jgi:deoxyribodipyrimidine photo-lyase
MTTLVWFRRDLRLADNPALHAAHAIGAPVVPLYIHAPGEEGAWAPGAASRWWLHESLQSLAADLASAGSRLSLRAGASALEELLAAARSCGADRIVWNRCYEPAAVARDQHIKLALRRAGLLAESHNSALLREPWEIATRSDAPFQVFTPFWRHYLSLPDPPAPLPAPARLAQPHAWPESVALERLGLSPVSGWSAGLREAWTPGRRGALQKLESFLHAAYAEYGDRRDRPDLAGTSRLSAHLHFGEIGPREVWAAVRAQGLAREPGADWRQSQFLTELGWREFAHHLLFHFPHTAVQPLRAKYADFPWKSDPQSLRRWQRGVTGYPIVDAGMRQLWRSGWMHNRVRMIAASFLVKDLLLSWNEGARWFWDTLVDADLASNTLGWQWAAGCGADAAPYFRIFNPMLQARKFDPEGAYVRRWVPELATLANDWIHAPWEAPAAALDAAGVRLGQDYPLPCVEHRTARTAALAALRSLRGP